MTDKAKTAERDKNAFSLIRYFFALSLFLFHFSVLTGCHHTFPVGGGQVVAAFFTMSGFLIFKSLQRGGGTRAYAKRRFMHIYPAYACCILLCTALGAFFSTLSFHDFFHNAQTWKYIFSNLAFLNFLQPALPGVFADNNLQAVNGSLWFMKVEVIFYISAPVLFHIYKRFNKHKASICVYIMLTTLCATTTYILWRADLNSLAPVENTLGGLLQIFCGVAAFQYITYIKRHIVKVLLFSAAIYAITYSCPQLHAVNSPAFALAIVCTAYLPERFYSIGIHTPRLWHAAASIPDITYGIYLYHFPVIQAVIAAGIYRKNPSTAFLASLLITVALATVSKLTAENTARP